MDYLEYTKKGFPLLACSVFLFMYSGVWLLLAILSGRAFYLLPMTMTIIPSALLFVMSLPRVYQCEPHFRRLEFLYSLLGGIYWMIWLGKLAFLAGAQWKRGDPVGVAILAGLLLSIPILAPLFVLLRKSRSFHAKESPVSAMAFQFDMTTARVCGAAVTILMMAHLMTMEPFPWR